MKPPIGQFVVRELLAHALQGVLGALPSSAPRSRDPDAEARAGAPSWPRQDGVSPGRASGASDGRQRLTSDGPAVVLVHGHAARPGGFLMLRRALARAGYARFLAHAYGPTGSAHGHARDLGRLVDRHAPVGDLLIIGHSLGGVIARAWLQEHAPLARVRAFVSLSSPHAGVPAARLIRPVPLLGELAPDSPLMRRLRAGDARLAAVPCTSIVSERDHYLWNPEAAAFAGAELLRVAHVGHVGLLFAPTVHALVVERLARAARPSP